MRIHRASWLRGCIQNCSLDEEIRAAWTRFSMSERKELTNKEDMEGRGGESSRESIVNEVDYSPLYEAVRYSNFVAIYYFLVSVYFFNVVIFLLNFGHVGLANCTADAQIMS